MENNEKNLNDEQEQSKFVIFIHNHFYIVSGLTVTVLILIGLIFFIIPKYNSLSQDRVVEEKEIQNEKENAQNYKNQLTVFINNYNLIPEEDKEKIQQIIPQENSIDILYPEIESLASQNALVITSLAITDTATLLKNSPQANSGTATSTANSNIGIIEIKLEVSGINYKNMQSFLKTLENNLRLMDVKNIEFKPEDGSASFIINTYYYKPAPKA